MKRQVSMDLLIVTCSPKGAKNLPALEKEAKEVQKTMPQSRCDTAVSPEALNDLLHEVKTEALSLLRPRRAPARPTLSLDPP